MAITWTAKASAPNQVRNLCPVGSAIYAMKHMGSGAQLYKYDIPTNVWSYPGGYPTADMNASFMILLGSTLYGFAPNHTLSRYDIGSSTWTTLTPSIKDHGIPVAEGVGDKIYVLAHSGYNGSEVYNPATTAWTVIAPMPGGYGPTGSAVDGSTIYVTSTDKFYAYDTVADTWTTKADFPVGVYGNAGTLARGVDGKIYLIGADTGGSYRASAAYNPGTNTWTVIPSPAVASASNIDAVASPYDGKLYLSQNGGGLYAGDGINEPPSAPIQSSPADTSTIDLTIEQQFGWAFSDSTPGDYQSKFNFYYRASGGATWAVITQSTPNNLWKSPPATFGDGLTYEWQVETYDKYGKLGGRTSSWFFTARTPVGVASITAPTSGGTVLSDQLVEWSTPDMDAFQLRRVADNSGAADPGTIYFDTGTINEPSTRSLSVHFPVNHRWEHIQIRTFFNGLWTEWVSVRIYVSYTPPMTPVVTLTPVPESGALDVAIVNPAPTGGAPVTAYNDVWVMDTGVWERRKTMLPVNSTWRYWTPFGDLDHEPRIVVIAVGSDGTIAQGYPPMDGYGSGPYGGGPYGG